MAQNRTMAIKHKKAREMASQEYKWQALTESMEDFRSGRIHVTADSLCMGRQQKLKAKLIATKPRYKDVSPLLLDYFRKELGL